jgi:hypothetical protein
LNISADGPPRYVKWLRQINYKLRSKEEPVLHGGSCVTVGETQQLGLTARDIGKAFPVCSIAIDRKLRSAAR